MSSTTPILGLPYLTLGNPPDIAGITKALAEAVEAQLVITNTALTGVASTASASAGRGVRRTMAADNNFSNQTTYGVLPQSADRTALTVSLPKVKSTTKLLLAVSGTMALTSGVAQRMFLGLRIGGVDYDVAQYPSLIAVSRSVVTGFAEVPAGLAAGTYTIEPVFRCATAAAVTFYASDDAISYSVREAA